MTNFDLSPAKRQKLFEKAISLLEQYYEHTAEYPITAPLDQQQIVDMIHAHHFDRQQGEEEALQFAIDSLKKYTVHTPHPGYFGLFNPRPTFPSILGDLIAAVLNPQMAAWSHAPFANEAERYMIQQFGQKFGYLAVDGVFASGGAEANHTAVLCALNAAFPTFANEGLFGMKNKPVIYCSGEVHHSIVKAARAVGLGLHAIINIPTDEQQRLVPEAIEQQLQKDKEAGLRPFMLVATAGTTGAGAIDDLPILADLARQHHLWFHVDAAYGGAAILSPKLQPFLNGIEKSDSITFDAHKWLSVPMAGSMFITSDPEILSKTFRITTAYMPREGQGMAIVDPYTHSMQWSRRFIGLKLYLSLLFFGWKGYQEVIEYQSNIGDYLDQQLEANGWTIKNTTPLPISCFTDDKFRDNPEFIPYVHKAILDNQQSWISIYPINGMPTLRACITNYQSNEKHIDQLINQLNRAREMFKR